MPEVWIPSRMQRLTGGRQRVRASGTSIRQVVNSLEEEYPGIKALLCSGDDLMPGIAVIVDGEATGLGLLQRVEEESEVHFLPAIGGGSSLPASPL